MCVIYIPGYSVSVICQRFALHALFMFYSVQCDELQLTSTLVKSEYSYFDPTTLSTWAGLQHWKIKPVKLKGQLLITRCLTLSTHVVLHFFLHWSTIRVLFLCLSPWYPPINRFLHASCAKNGAIKPIKVALVAKRFINPRRACAARVTVLGLSVRPSVTTFSATTRNKQVK